MLIIICIYSEIEKVIKANNRTKNITETNKKGYFDKFKGMYVYIRKDLEGKIVYVGETMNYYKRLSNHKSKCVKTTKEFISKGNYTIQYLDISTKIKTERELLYLENVLIDLYEPVLNDVKKHYNRCGQTKNV
jgi:predicted GIY-YIG superfamily endonuclease